MNGRALGPVGPVCPMGKRSLKAKIIRLLLYHSVTSLACAVNIRSGRRESLASLKLKSYYF